MNKCTNVFSLPTYVKVCRKLQLILYIIIGIIIIICYPKPSQLPNC